MGELQETIGGALLPVIGKLAGFLTTTLLPALEATFGWIMDNKDVVIAALIAIGAVLLPMFISWAIAAGAAAIATIAAAAPFIAIGAVIAGVAYLIIHNWDTIVAATSAAWDAVLGAVKFVWDWIKQNWPILLAVITGPIGAAVLVVVRNWDTIKGAAEAVWDWLNGTWQSLTSIITAPIRSASDIVSGLFGAIENAATSAYNWVKSKFDAMGDAISAVVGAVSSAVGSVVNAIKNPINAVIRAWNGLEFRVPTVNIPEVHIPGFPSIGGGTIGGQTIGFPDLPQLAAGGILTSPTLFIGGEAGTEIVAPEALLRQIMREERGGYTLNIYPRTADASDIAYGFRRLELMAGVT
jgi:phage-related protein